MEKDLSLSFSSLPEKIKSIIKKYIFFIQIITIWKNICSFYFFFSSIKRLKRQYYYFPSGHSNVVTIFSQCHCWCCHNIVAVKNESRMDVSFRHCYNISTTLSIGLLGHFTMDYSDFFPIIEMWELQSGIKHTSFLFKRMSTKVYISKPIEIY